MRVITIIFGVLFCTVSEVFSAPKRTPCPTLQLKHGRVRYRTKNRFVKFMCNPGYILAGEKYSTCENGAWDGPSPKCVRPSCTKVQAPPNVIIYPSHRGGVLNFFCKPGFALRGDNITYCDGNKWDNRLPTCTETTKSPPLACDFESEDLCGWNHDLRHDFDWTRKNFNTPSGHLGTGPSYDHTKGVGGDGYYMYIESSSRNENDTARMISPIFDKMNDSPVCFEFYYHMYGSTTGQLRVYLKKLSDSWNLDPKKAIFWKTGNHGNVWFDSWHNLGPIDEDFQMIIEGVRGKSFYSDIAIDDVRIIPNCTDDEFTTTSDALYTFDDEAIPSCYNRCDTSSISSVYGCDCDDSCIDNGSCCLDYIVVCVLDGTEEYSTTIDSTLMTSGSTPMITSTKLATTTSQRTTTKRTLPTTTTTKARKTTKASQTTTKTTPRPTTKTTPKTTPKTTARPTTKATPKITTKTTPRPTRKTTRRPTTKAAPKPTTKITPTTNYFDDDVVTMPQLKEEPEVEEIFTFNPANQNTIVPVKMATVEKTQPTTNNIVIAVCVVILIIGAALLVVGLMRYKPICKNLKHLKSSNGDSQSDVRFLTSDEILNFNLAYVDD